MDIAFGQTLSLLSDQKRDRTIRRSPGTLPGSISRTPVEELCEYHTGILAPAALASAKRTSSVNSLIPVSSRSSESS